MLKFLILFTGLMVCHAQKNVSTTTTIVSSTISLNSTITAASSSISPDSTEAITVAPVIQKVFNFSVNNTDNTQTCLKAQFALNFHIKYEAINGEGKVVNTTLDAALDDINDYMGECGDTMNTLIVQFWNQWTINFTYTLKDNKYKLDSISLNYYVNSTWFPNATESASGYNNATNNALDKFPAQKGNSYKCVTATKINLNEMVDIDVSEYQAQPFYNKPDAGFDIGVNCQDDSNNTSKLVPIIVGAALAVTVLLVLMAYLVGRRRHRSGYATV